MLIEETRERCHLLQEDFLDAFPTVTRAQAITILEQEGQLPTGAP